MALNCIFTLSVLCSVTAICLILKVIDNTANYASVIYILGVFLVAMFTNGYAYGLVSSLLSVLLVNFVFTYPFLSFDFTLSGYPVSFLCMSVVSVATSTLISKNKRQEKLKIETEKEKTRNNLLRAISHDIRTPLTSINGACSLLIENDNLVSQNERIELLTDIKEDSDWLIRIVENLLSITRIDNNESKIVKTPEPIEEVVAEAISKFNKRYNHKINTSIPEDLILIPMDAILIEQVIINLLENAVIHSGNATNISLTVKSFKSSVKFTVSDNGKGIDKKILNNILAGKTCINDHNSKDTRHCLGIGLSVCSTIIKAHGGTIIAYNNTNGGASFEFLLPVKE